MLPYIAGYLRLNRTITQVASASASPPSQQHQDSSAQPMEYITLPEDPTLAAQLLEIYEIMAEDRDRSPRNCYASAPPSPNISAAMPKYESCISLLHELATSPPHSLSQVEFAKLVRGTLEDVSRHSSVRGRQELDREGRRWLTELLVWEKLFPNNTTHPFPPSSIRPLSTSSHPRALSPHTLLPFCECCACLSYPQGDSRCPYIRFATCEKHGMYKVRVGSEKGACRGCSSEEDKEWCFVERGEGNGDGSEDGEVVVEGEWEGWDLLGVRGEKGGDEKGEKDGNGDVWYDC